MPTRPLLSLLLLLSMMTNCTAFGPDGTLPMALHRDMANLHLQCHMSDEEWMEKCGDDFWSKPAEEWDDCPLECRPPRRLKR